MAYIARDIYNTPDSRANVVGVEIEETQPITLYAANGSASFYVRYVTQFDNSGSSSEFGVQSSKIDITYDAMTNFLTKLINDAKQQNKLKNGTTVVFTGSL